MTRLKKCIPILLVTTLSASLVIGCGEKEPEESTEQIIQVETIQPQRESISVQGSFVGTIETEASVSVYPQISGQVVEKYFEVGDHVNAGDTLFVMDDRALQIAKRDADASVKSAAASLEAQKANSAATQAAANESIGSIATKEYELAKAYNDAGRDMASSHISEKNYRDQAAIQEGEMNRSASAMRAAQDQESNARELYNKLNDKKNTYLDIAKADSLEKAQQIARDQGVNFEAESDSQEDIAAKYISQKTRYTDYQELTTAAEAASQLAETAKAEKASQEGTYTSSLSQKLEAAANAEIAKGNVTTAAEAQALAQKMFLDYEQYTKASTIAAANAQVAEGNANVAVSGSQLEAAKASQDLAALNLSNAAVRAPISGVIGEINVVQYGMASDQTAAYVITGQDNKKICFGIPETMLHKIKVGQPVTISKDDQQYTAVVTKVNNSLNGSTLFKVEASLQGEGTEGFIVGTKLKLETAVDFQENALTIPMEAIFYDDGKPFVYVAQGNKAVRKDIETGLSNKTKIQVVSGLEETDSIITSWSSALKDQTTIQANAKKNEVSQEAEESKQTEHAETVDLSATESSKDNAAQQAGTLVETTDSVNVRKSPDTTGEILTTAVAGERFEKISEENGWTKIKYVTGDSSEAFVKSDYVKSIEGDQHE